MLMRWTVSKALRRAPAPFAALLVAGCAAAVPIHPLAPRRVETVEQWRVERGGRPIGTVSRIRILDPAGPVERYEVLTSGGQRAGFIDLQGRVYQRLPFEDREVFRGIHPMENALAMLYEVDPPLRIVPEDAPEMPASAAR